MQRTWGSWRKNQGKRPGSYLASFQLRKQGNGSHLIEHGDRRPGHESWLTCEALDRFLNFSDLQFSHQQNGLFIILAYLPQRQDCGVASKTIKL